MAWIDEIKQALAENPGKSVGDIIPIARERWNKKKAAGLTDVKPSSNKAKSVKSSKKSPTTVVDSPESSAPESAAPESSAPESATPESAAKKSKKRSKKAKKGKKSKGSTTKKSKKSAKKSRGKGKSSSKKSKRGGGCGCEATLFQ